MILKIILCSYDSLMIVGPVAIPCRSVPPPLFSYQHRLYIDLPSMDLFLNLTIAKLAIINFIPGPFMFEVDH